MKALTGFAPLALLLPLSAAGAEPMPAAVAAMIESAAGDAATLGTVATIAKKTYPGSASEIDARVGGINAARDAARVAKLESQSFTQGWSGEGTVGAFTSSGNTVSTGVAIGIKLAKESVRWKNSVNGVVDYQRENGKTSKERFFAGYDINYKFSDRFYALGLLSWEKDRYAGFDRRFSEGLGLGYKVIDTPTVSLALEGGPALRQTKFITGLTESSFNGRVAGNFKWTLGPSTALTEVASYYFGSNTSTLTSETALTTKLYNALSGRISFYLQNESNPPLGRKATDTTSRVSLVYGF